MTDFYKGKESIDFIAFEVVNRIILELLLFIEMHLIGWDIILVPLSWNGNLNSALWIYCVLIASLSNFNYLIILANTSMSCSIIYLTIKFVQNKVYFPVLSNKMTCLPSNFLWTPNNTPNFTLTSYFQCTFKCKFFLSIHSRKLLYL